MNNSLELEKLQKEYEYAEINLKICSAICSRNKLSKLSNIMSEKKNKLYSLNKIHESFESINKSINSNISNIFDLMLNKINKNYYKKFYDISKITILQFSYNRFKNIVERTFCTYPNIICKINCNYFTNDIKELLKKYNVYPYIYNEPYFNKRPTGSDYFYTNVKKYYEQDLNYLLDYQKNKDCFFKNLEEIHKKHLNFIEQIKIIKNEITELLKQKDKLNRNQKKEKNEIEAANIGVEIAKLNVMINEKNKLINELQQSTITMSNELNFWKDWTDISKNNKYIEDIKEIFKCFDNKCKVLKEFIILDKEFNNFIEKFNKDIDKNKEEIEDIKKLLQKLVTLNINSKNIYSDNSTSDCIIFDKSINNIMSIFKYYHLDIDTILVNFQSIDIVDFMDIFNKIKKLYLNSEDNEINKCIDTLDKNIKQSNEFKNQLNTSLINELNIEIKNISDEYNSIPTNKEIINDRKKLEFIQQQLDEINAKILFENTKKKLEEFNK